MYELFALIIEPVESGVRGAVSALDLAAVRSTTCSQDTVGNGYTLAATGIPEIEPFNGTSPFRASGSRGGSLDMVDLLSDEELVGLVEVEGWDTSSVEEVVTKVGDFLTETLNLERFFLREGVGVGGATILVAVQRDIPSVENIRSKRSPFLWC